MTGNCAITVSRLQHVLLKPSISPPAPRFHSSAPAAGTGRKGELCEGEPIWKQSLTINHSDWCDYSVPDATGRTVLYNSSTENTSCRIPSPPRSDTTKGNSPKQQPGLKTEFTTAINQMLQPSICLVTVCAILTTALMQAIQELLKDQFYFCQIAP